MTVESTIERPRKMYSPRPPAPIAAATVAVPMPIDRRDAHAGDDRRQRERQLDEPQKLPRCHAHRHARLALPRVDRSSGPPPSCG